MIKASEAINKSFEVQQKNLTAEFDALLKLVEEQVKTHIQEGGESETYVDVTNFESESITLVAEAIRKYGYKTSLQKETESEYKMIDGEKTIVKTESQWFLLVSAAHLTKTVLVKKSNGKDKQLV